MTKFFTEFEDALSEWREEGGHLTFENGWHLNLPDEVMFGAGKFESTLHALKRGGLSEDKALEEMKGWISRLHYLQFECHGKPSGESFKAAEAMAKAIEEFEPRNPMKWNDQIIERAIEILGDGWDKASIEACLEGYSFYWIERKVYG